MANVRWPRLKTPWLHGKPVGVSPGPTGARVEPPEGRHLELGRRGEELAARFLEDAGYRMVASNFKLPVGRSLRGRLINAEIDLVAYENDTLCFIEVKSRVSDWYASPEVNVDLRKQRQITRAARAYRRAFDLRDAPYRYDVVSVILPEQGPLGSRVYPKVQVLRNFWTEEKFRKRRWSGR